MLLFWMVKLTPQTVSRRGKGEAHDFTQLDHLRRGVNLSLNLAYNEPWGQMQQRTSSVHCFSNKARLEAERLPCRHQALERQHGGLGLKLCLEARGDAPEELAEVTALFNERSPVLTQPAKPVSAQDSIENSCC